MILVYRIVWWALLPIVRLIHILVTLAHSFLKKNTPFPKWVLALEERFAIQKYPLIRPKPLWIHCASGEFENLRAFIRLTHKCYPHLPILLTYSSPTLKRWINKNLDLPEVRALEAYCAHPFDSQKDVTHFIRHFGPRALIISRTDLWPEMLHQLREQKIPAILAAATLGKGQKKSNWLYRFYVRWNLNLLSEIWCCTDTDARNFRTLGTDTHCRILGEPRFDQAVFRVQNPSKSYIHQSFALKIAHNIPLLFASTWSQDDIEIEKCLAILKTNQIRFIWAPHETTPSHIHSIAEKLLKAGISFQRSTDLKLDDTFDQQALLVDQVGILADLYAHTRVAFVGGSFKKQVHSVLEPLAHRNLVLVGPHHQNSREAMDFQSLNEQGFPLVTCFQSGDELGSLILSRLKWAKPHQSVIESQTGASLRMLNALSALRVIESVQGEV